MELLNTAFSKAHEISLREARMIKLQDNVDETEKLFVTTTFHPGDNRLHDIIGRNQEVLQRSSTTKDMSDDRPVFGS